MAAKKAGVTPRVGAFPDLAIAINGSPAADGVVTARVAGGLYDLRLPISPAAVPLRRALHNMAKAINVALQEDFLETELEPAYRAARVRKGRVWILHREYIGLGDGVMGAIGRLARSASLTLKGPDPASPEGKRWIEEFGQKGAFRGVLNLFARKMDLVQEYEDQVPVFVEQMLDRLESVRVIVGWNRDEWEIGTSTLGLDVEIRASEEVVAKREAELRAREGTGKKKTGSGGKKTTKKKASPRKAGKKAD